MKYALVALMGCATAAPTKTTPPPAEPRLEPLAGWNEVTSPHFQLWIHGAVAKGEALLRDMEDLRRMIVGVAFQAYDAPGPVMVLALQDREETDLYIPRGYAALTVPRTIALRPVIIVDANARVDDRRTLTHELTHAVSFNAFAVQPIWFAEGLATYFEALTLAGTKAEIGAPSPYIGKIISHHRMTPLHVAFECEEVACRDAGFYAASWAIFTYLLNENRPALGRYMTALAKLPRDGKAPTWDELVPEFEIEELQAALDQWLAHGHIAVSKYNVEPRPPTLAHRALAPAEVHVARSLLWRLVGREDKGKDDLVSALAEDPTDVVANLLRLKTLTQAQAKAVATAHPDDWRAHVLDNDFPKACEVLAAHPDANAPAELGCQSATGAPR